MKMEKEKNRAGTMRGQEGNSKGRERKEEHYRTPVTRQRKEAESISREKRAMRDRQEKREREGEEDE